MLQSFYGLVQICDVTLLEEAVRQLTPPHPHHFMSSTPFCGILDAPIQVFLLGLGETEVVKGIWGASGRVCSVRHVDEQECSER